MTKQVNFFYASYVRTMMKIDENQDGLFCQVPSESDGFSYTVQVDESGVCPIVSSCSCQGFRYYGHCKHETIVNQFYAKLYKSNIAKAEMKALEQAMDASDLIEEQYEEVAFVEQIATTIEDQTPSTVKVAQPVASSKIAPSKVVKVDHHSIRTASFFSALPSRQKKEVPVNREAQIEAAKKEILLEEEIARRLSLLKSEKMDGLKFIAQTHGLAVKSRKRIDYINAIIEYIRKSLELKEVA